MALLFVNLLGLCWEMGPTITLVWFSNASNV